MINVRMTMASACLLFGLATGLLLGAGPATLPAGGDGELAGLTAEVVPTTQSAKPGEEVKAVFRITNGGKANKSFKMMSCSWPTEWKSSSTSVSVAMRGCGRNGQIIKTLAPGEKWEGNGSLQIDAGAPAGALAATFTFSPSQGGGTITSAAVTLTVSGAK